MRTTRIRGQEFAFEALLRRELEGSRQVLAVSLPSHLSSPLWTSTRHGVFDGDPDQLGIGLRAHPSPDFGQYGRSATANPCREITSETMIEPRDLDQTRRLA